MKRTRANVAAAITATVMTLAVAWPAAAVPVPIPMLEKDFADLGPTGPKTAVCVEPFDYQQQFTGTVYSQAFNLADGRYGYLYQVDNDGPDIMEKLVVFPFYGVDEGGSLIAGEPVGFLVGGVPPSGASYDVAIPDPTVGFDYPSVTGGHVSAGEHTRVLYLISPNEPTMGEAHLIDGGIGIVEVWVAVPEPTALSLLGLAGAAWLARRRRR